MEEQRDVPEDIQTSGELREILKNIKTIAIVGLSPKEERDSNRVAKYLMEQGYEIVPVNPGQREILGKKCYGSLKDIPFKVEVVDMFLNPVRISPVVDQAIEIGAKVIWMQLGIVHIEAAEKAREAGIKVVMDKCIKIEHEKIL
ncbi:CoA-binding protein [Thermodesulfobacteriota bacterium]